MDSDDGRDVESIVGLEDLFESDFSGEMLLAKRARDYILKDETPRKIPRLTFAILDAAFGTQSLVISETGGPVRCIDSSTAIELWRFTPEKDSHFLDLWFRNVDGNFYGVPVELQTRQLKAPRRLNAGSGEAQILRALDSWEEAYSAKLDCVITSGGELIDLSEGRLLHRLEFRQTDYLDRKNVELPKV